MSKKENDEDDGVLCVRVDKKLNKAQNSSSKSCNISIGHNIFIFYPFRNAIFLNEQLSRGKFVAAILENHMPVVYFSSIYKKSKNERNKRDKLSTNFSF